jgi:hypothetical protein
MSGSGRLASGRGTRRSSAAADGLPEVLVPEVDAARDARVVGGYTDVVEQIADDVGGVSAPQIQHVVMQQGIDDLDRIKDAAVPLLGARRRRGKENPIFPW